ncbi:hypothetical protein NQ314_012821 [Rhamnusium bicolor]|uniref:ATP-dependent RNA helicase DHX30 n=1 Tax=Rhamnusium bicolor TaxID=1586634 RepID=A0AAV8X9Y3_9CUCU|nr:hypothetical protein NQ314_012821 [Rhamnusium bicolor]
MWRNILLPKHGNNIHKIYVFQVGLRYRFENKIPENKNGTRRIVNKIFLDNLVSDTLKQNEFRNLPRIVDCDIKINQNINRLKVDHRFLESSTILKNNNINITNQIRLKSTNIDRSVNSEEVLTEKTVQFDDLIRNTPPVPILTNKIKDKVKEIYYADNEECRQILKLYPAPKNVLHNVYDLLSSEMNKKLLKLTPNYKSVKDQKNSKWICMYHLHWPEEIKFLAMDTKKSVASHKAALVALSWLKNNGKINNEGMPIIYEKDEIKKLSRKTFPALSLDKKTVEYMKKIIELHQTQIVPHIIKSKLEIDPNNNSLESESGLVEEPADINLKSVNRQKYIGLEQYMAKEKIKLPIAPYKEQFIKLLKDNRIIIVKGEPGCGKSTRIPQYVLEAWAKEDGLLGQPGRIAVTQPRRIAAISLAERVSSERDEVVGNIVGYQVRLKSNFRPQSGRILYCTTGILLRHLQSDSNLSNFTYVILDEAHERDVNTDLLMNLLRNAIKTNPNLKLIVMSATIDTDVFSEYFEGAPVIEIPGFTYPVTQHFLDSFKINVNKTLDMCNSQVPTVIHDDVVTLIEYIHDHKKEGAILCFLPGWEDIRKIQRMIPINGDIAVYCLHSRLQDSEQWKIFSRPPPGVRKVILATNIAETSVTIDDVVYVIDTGIHKDNRFDVEKGISCVDNHWISKASARQRKGRAGRVQPGECFCLYPRSKYESFSEYSLPEILRTSLTKIVLDSKVFSNNMNAIEFMHKLLTSPDDNATLRAVQELKDLELLDAEENLTTLGKTVANFQLEPKLSKAMVNAVIFKCVTPIVDIVTLFSAETEIFVSGLLDKEDVKNVKMQFCKDSDHLAMMRIFEKWLEFTEEGDTYRLKSF